MAENNAWGRDSRRGSSQPRAVGAREATPVESTRPAGRGGSATPREARELYHSQSPWQGKGTVLYPRDESMRYRGDPTGERLTHAEMEQKVRLERCFGGRSQPGPKNGGRIPIKGPAPVSEEAAPDYGPVGSRRPPPPRTVMPPPAPPRGAAPPPIRIPLTVALGPRGQ